MIIDDSHYYIDIKKDKIKIDGILMFGRGCMINVGTDSNISVEVTNNTLICCTPRWYQLKKWWDLIQGVRIAAPPF